MVIGDVRGHRAPYLDGYLTHSLVVAELQIPSSRYFALTDVRKLRADFLQSPRPGYVCQRILATAPIVCLAPDHQSGDSVSHLSSACARAEMD